MKLSLLVVISLLHLGLSFAQVEDSPPGSLKDLLRKSSLGRNVSLLNPELEGIVPPLASKGPVQGPLTPSVFENQPKLSPFMFGDNVNLQWQSWRGTLPTGAVGIYNGYTGRTDYICNYGCSAGFYTPSKGPYCKYPYGNKENSASQFEVLTNIDNFELLEWKEDSYGSVPQNSINTCPGGTTYVGKNKYGLGKVVPKFGCLFLPWEGSEYSYKYYQVLTINRDAYSQHISQVKYSIDEVKIFQNPPEGMHFSSVINNGCQELSKTVTISKTSEVIRTWNIGRTTMLGVTASITASIPLIGSGGVEFSTEETLQLNKGTTNVEAVTHSVSLEVRVPPNHCCSVRMEGRKITADIPYTARLSRKYRNGETQWTTITGVYDGVQIGEIRAVVDRCEPIADAKPCV